jgi:hypothetical protein
LTGSEVLTEHLRFWLDAITDIGPNLAVRVESSAFDAPALLEGFRATVSADLPVPPSATVIEDLARERGRVYYRSGAIRIAVEDHPSIGEIGDGGFTDWTARLMADSEERCLISCVASGRLTAAANVSSEP